MYGKSRLSLTGTALEKNTIDYFPAIDAKIDYEEREEIAEDVVWKSSVRGAIIKLSIIAATMQFFSPTSGNLFLLSCFSRTGLRNRAITYY